MNVILVQIKQHWFFVRLGFCYSRGFASRADAIEHLEKQP